MIVVNRDSKNNKKELTEFFESIALEVFAGKNYFEIEFGAEYASGGFNFEECDDGAVRIKGGIRMSDYDFNASKSIALKKALESIGINGVVINDYRYDGEKTRDFLMRVEQKDLPTFFEILEEKLLAYAKTDMKTGSRLRRYDEYEGERIITLSVVKDPDTRDIEEVAEAVHQLASGHWCKFSFKHNSKSYIFYPFQRHFTQIVGMKKEEMSEEFKGSLANAIDYDKEFVHGKTIFKMKYY